MSLDLTRWAPVAFGQALAAVRSVAVIGTPDEKWGELVTALVDQERQVN